MPPRRETMYGRRPDEHAASNTVNTRPTLRRAQHGCCLTWKSWRRRSQRGRFVVMRLAGGGSFLRAAMYRLCDLSSLCARSDSLAVRIALRPILVPGNSSLRRLISWMLGSSAASSSSSSSHCIDRKEAALDSNDALDDGRSDFIERDDPRERSARREALRCIAAGPKRPRAASVPLPNSLARCCLPQLAQCGAMCDV